VSYGGQIPEDLLDGRCPVLCPRISGFYCMVEADRGRCPSNLKLGVCWDCEHALFKSKLHKLQNLRSKEKASRNT